MNADALNKMLDTIKTDYSQTLDSAAAREALQGLFDAGFDMMCRGKDCRNTLDGAYTFLRKLRNAAEPKCCNSFRYDAALLTENLIFAAEILSVQGDVKFGFECDFFGKYISLPQDDFSFAFLNILANCAVYSRDGYASVTLRESNNCLLIKIGSRSFFDCREFYTAVSSHGSIGFAYRLFRKNGGNMFLAGDLKNTAICIVLPFAQGGRISEITTAENLLCDRLSPAYIAFCGHG